MVKKGQLAVSKMDSDRQGQDRNPQGRTPDEMEGHMPGNAGTADQKRSYGSRSQRRARPQTEGSS